MPMDKSKSENKGKKLTFQLKWPEKATFELQIVIPWNKIRQEYQATLRTLAAETQIPGFRKGKAPLATVEEKIGKEKIYQHLIQRLIPSLYQEALQQHQLSPIIEPQIILESVKENQPWKIKIISCVAPQVKLGKYKEEIRKINASGKIWTPQKGTKEATEEEKALEKEKLLQQILQKLTEVARVKIPSLVIKSELQRRLASLIDQLQKAGLTLDQYLYTKKQTIEELKKELRSQITREWQLELILEKVADEEKITVDEKEIKSLEKNKSPLNPYLLARLVRRRKTLDYLASL